MDVFLPIQKEIIGILSNDLDKRFCYHNTDHTLDVITQTERIARSEGVTSPADLIILRIAALFHDTGFLYTYSGHEERSCQLVMEKLGHKFPASDLETICSLIRATKVPQEPSTLLEQIICDADLDYLGRRDFRKLSNSLRSEFLHFGIVKNEEEWEQKQIAFFESHHYFTRTSIESRLPNKMKHLHELKLEAKE